MNILFVCTGNLCRSPTAQILFQQMLEKEGVSGVVLTSRGLSPYEGQPMPEGVEKALRDAGATFSGHRSKRVCSEDIEKADLILVMEEAHLKQLQTLFPDAATKAFLFKEYAESEGEGNIPDPMGGSPSDYEESRIEIQNALKDLLIKLKADPSLPSNLNRKEIS